MPFSEEGGTVQRFGLAPPRGPLKWFTGLHRVNHFCWALRALMMMMTTTLMMMIMMI